MLCLLYNDAHQPYVYADPLFWITFPLGHHGALKRRPCPSQYVLISFLFYTQRCVYVNPNLPRTPLSPFPLAIHKCVRYICVSISALQIGPSVPLGQEMGTHSSTLAWRIPMDRGAWWATVHGVANSWTPERLSTCTTFLDSTCKH